MATKATKGKGKEKTSQGSMTSRPTPTRVSNRIAAKKQTIPDLGKKEEKDINTIITHEEQEEIIPMEEEESSSAVSTPSPSRNHSPTPTEDNLATPKASKKRRKATTPLTNTTTTTNSTNTSLKIKPLPAPLFPTDHILGNYPLLEKFDQRIAENPFHFGPNATFHNQNTKEIVPPHTTLNTQSHDQFKQATEEIGSPSKSGTNPIQITSPPEWQLWIKFTDIQGTSLPNKYQQIRGYFTNIKGFHNVIAPRKTKEVFKVTFTSEEATKKAQEKAIQLGIATTTDHPTQHNQAERTIIIKEIPLGTSKEEIKASFEEYGEIEEITWSLVGLWQKAHIIYKSTNSLVGVDTQWSTMIGKDSVRIVTATNTAEKLKTRAQFTLKLTQLPQGTTAHDIWTYIRSLGGMTCKIPRTTPSYNRQKFAIVEFSNQDEKTTALQDQPTFKGKPLIWIEPAVRTCHICGDPNHISTHCKQKKPTKQDISNDRRTTILAGIYQKKHVAISTPVGFGGMRWADILKTKPKNTIPNQTNNNTNSTIKTESSSSRNIEARLDKLEKMVSTIIEHLNNKLPEHSQHTTNNISSEKEKPIQLRSTNIETIESSNQTMDEDIILPNSTTNTNPQQTIDEIKRSYTAPEDQVEALSLAIHTIHQTTTNRIQKLEATMEELIKKFSNQQLGRRASDAESNATQNIDLDQ